MVFVQFLGPIGEKEMEFDVKNLSELKTKLQEIPSISKWLPISAIALNDVIIKDMNAELKNGDKLIVLPPVCGG